MRDGRAGVGVEDVQVLAATVKAIVARRAWRRRAHARRRRPSCRPISAATWRLVAEPLVGDDARLAARRRRCRIACGLTPITTRRLAAASRVAQRRRATRLRDRRRTRPLGAFDAASATRVGRQSRTRRRKDVHRRLADEGADEEVGRAAPSARAAWRYCCSTPPSMTAMRSASALASVWSCVTRIGVMRCSRR